MKFSGFGIRLMMVVCLLIQMPGVVQSSGTLELKMNYFRNPSEQLADTSCCDPNCKGECDNIFYFGLDRSTGGNDPRSNSYFTKTTGSYQDQDDINFSDQMNGVNNPIKWDFETWPGSVLFKVYIEDDDQPYNENDYLDGMVYEIRLTPATSEASAIPTTVSIEGQRPKEKTILSMTYKCYCKDKYFGPTCSVYCEPQDSGKYGHYTCDKFTGAKLCRSGYKKPSGDCKQKSKKSKKS